MLVRVLVWELGLVLCYVGGDFKDTFFLLRGKRAKERSVVERWRECWCERRWERGDVRAGCECEMCEGLVGASALSGGGILKMRFFF